MELDKLMFRKPVHQKYYGHPLHLSYGFMNIFLYILVIVPLRDQNYEILKAERNILTAVMKSVHICVQLIGKSANYRFH